MTIGHRRVNPEQSGCPGGRAPVDPRELAREIVQGARPRDGLLIFTDFERTLCLGATKDAAPGCPAGPWRLVALASTPATGWSSAPGKMCATSRPTSTSRASSTPGAGDFGPGVGMTFAIRSPRDSDRRCPCWPKSCRDALGLSPGGGRDQGAGRHGACSTSRPAGRCCDRGPGEALRRTSAGDFEGCPSQRWTSSWTWSGAGLQRAQILVHWAHEGRGQPAVVYRP
jgi:hypothetical protein